MKKNLYTYLAGNEYPGRGICIGRSPDGTKAMIAYWIMGVRKIEARQEQEVHMPRSQRIFANMLHVNRSSLNQELKQMEREGYFRLDKERLLHVEGERLKELL